MPRRAAVRVSRALLAVLLCCVASLSGQDTPAKGLSSAELDAKLASAVQTAELDAEQRKSIEALYAEAKRFASAAEQSSARVAEFNARIRSAPQRLEAARAELEAQTRSWEVAGKSTSELEQLLRIVTTTRESDEANVNSIARERQQRATRLQQLPQMQADQKSQLAELRASSLAVVDGEPAVQTEARTLRRQARLQALEVLVAELDAELRVYAAEAQLLEVQEKRAEAQFAASRKAVEDIEKRIQEQRKADAMRDAEKADRQAKGVHSSLDAIAKENRDLAELRQRIAADLETVSGELEDVTKRRLALDERVTEIRKRIKIAGLTDAIGLQLRQEKSKLPSRAFYQRRASQRRSQIVDAQLQQIEVEERRDALLADDSKEVRDVLAGLPADIGLALRTMIQGQGLELMRARKGFLEDVWRDAGSYVTKLVALDTEERLLVRSADAFGGYVDERVLWIRSTKPIWATELSSLGDSIAWLGKSSHWASLAPALLEVVRRHPVSFLLGVLVVLVLVLSRRRMVRRITQLEELAGKRLTTTIAPTLEALVWSCLVALPGPLLFYVLGTHLIRLPNVSSFVHAFGSGLEHAALIYGGLAFARQVLRPHGLGEAHFRWSEVRTKTIRRHLTWFLPAIVPLSIVLRMLTVHGYVPWAFALDRILLIVALLLTAAVLWRMLNLRTGAFARVRSDGKTGSFARLDALWFLVAVTAPIALAALAVAGFHFTALELLYRLERSLAVCFAALVFYAIAIRWMLLAKRRLAIQQAKARQAARKAREAERAAAGEAIEDAAQQISYVEEAVDLATVDTQSRKVVRGAVAVLVVLSFWAIWADVLPALGLLDDVALWQSTTETSRVVDGKTITELTPSVVSLGSLLLSLLLIVATIAAARNVPGILELTVLQRFQVQAGERYAITTLVRYAIITAGIIAAFGAIGIGWGKVQWLVAAVSVGLGFGLQEIFANFVSGLIILFERPVRIGDLVTVEGVDGYVTRIRMRATTILDFDRREMIVPNKNFVTSRLVNWTLTDTITRVIIRVGIAYGSDVAKARKVLVEVARKNEHVLDEPNPSALFLGFGDSSLNFELRVFTASRDHWPQLRDGLHSEIDAAFRKSGIEIPFPQRDIHIRSEPPSRARREEGA